jgi:hypothetical protein
MACRMAALRVRPGGLGDATMDRTSAITRRRALRAVWRGEFAVGGPDLRSRGGRQDGEKAQGPLFHQVLRIRARCGEAK